MEALQDIWGSRENRFKDLKKIGNYQRILKMIFKYPIFYGIYIPVWIFRCVTSSDDVLNFFGQNGHEYFRTSEWNAKWLRNTALRVKLLLHFGQSNILSFSCVIIWLFQDDHCTKPLPVKKKKFNQLFAYGQKNRTKSRIGCYR